MLDGLHGDGAFSIMPAYLKLAAAGARIAPFSIAGAHWYDIGSFETLAEADRYYAARAPAVRQ